MTKPGRIVCSRMGEVIYGKPAAEAVSDSVSGLGAERVFLMVSGMLNRTIDQIEKY